MQWLIDILLDSFKGIIVAWSGTLLDIPAGWQLCDGTNGTPDLHDRFIFAPGTSADPHETGGTVSHIHGKGTGAEAGKAMSNQAEHIPPFYCLAFIQKMPKA